VLLVEAGGSERRLTTRVPLLASMQYGTSLDWAYETDPEPGCAGRRIAQPRGRVLGGCSAMNAMYWIKGSNLDYDGWRLPGWGWDDVAPVFARIEQGPMHITRSPYPDELSHRFVASARAAGVAANDDVSGPDLDGAAITPVNIHKGQRWSTARGYLRHQNNLTVVTKASVDRVIIRNGRAVGIEYRRRGHAHQAFADHEVVLSAGAFGTPQLLQVSGIGPADHLGRVGVTPLVDSPRVGQGLADHPLTWAVWSLAPGHVGLADVANPKWLLQWLLRRSGKLTSNGGEALAHIRSTVEAPACDVQLVFTPADALGRTAWRKICARIVGWPFVLDTQEPRKCPHPFIGFRCTAGDPDEPAHRARGCRGTGARGPAHSRDHRHRADRIDRRARTPARCGRGYRGLHQGHRENHQSSGVQRRDGQ
jgi:choline dehydrogenase